MIIYPHNHSATRTTQDVAGKAVSFHPKENPMQKLRNKLIALAATVVLLTIPGPLLRAQNGGAKPDLQSAVISTSTNQITIQGAYFGNSVPTVTLDSIALQVLTFSSSAVTAALPGTLAPGSYELELTNAQTNQTGVLSVALAASQPQGSHGIQEFMQPGPFVVPAGVTSLLVEMWGGGGGGAGFVCLGNGSGGGGSGGYTRAVLPVAPGATYQVKVGTGGAGGFFSIGGGGGESNITDASSTVLVRAGGGQGGMIPPPGCGIPGAGGAGGAAGVGTNVVGRAGGAGQAGTLGNPAGVGGLPPQGSIGIPGAKGGDGGVSTSGSGSGGSGTNGEVLLTW